MFGGSHLSMNGFALDPVSDRRLIIEQVAARRGILGFFATHDIDIGYIAKGCAATCCPWPGPDA